MSELEITSHELTPDAVPDRVDDLARIGELIAGDSPEVDPPESSSSDDEPPIAPDPGEAPEMEAADPDDPGIDEPPEPVKIDYEMEVPMPDGADPVTLGQLKDHYQQTVDFDEQRSKWEQHRTAVDAKHIALKQELSAMADLIGDANPALVQHVRGQLAEHRKAEQQALLELYPEWADPEVKRAQAPKLKAVAQRLGFSEAEFAHISDHRQIRALVMLDGFLTKQDAAAEAKAQLKAKLPKGQKTVKRRQTEAQKQRDKIARAKHGTQAEKTAAISALIRG
jgi:hypothetical protein